jgi:uncharacterized protein YxeA
MTSEQAEKVSNDLTKVSLEKLQKNIQQTNAFEVPKFTSISDDDHESDASSVSIDSSNYKKQQRSSYKSDINQAMYRDNQKLWEKNQKLGIQIERANKASRYLKMDHNNKCIELTEGVKRIECLQVQEKKLKSSNFALKFRLFFCVIYVVYSILQFNLEIMVIETLLSKANELYSNVYLPCYQQVQLLI